jgi:hypothetical protein
MIPRRSPSPPLPGKGRENETPSRGAIWKRKEVKTYGKKRLSQAEERHRKVRD